MGQAESTLDRVRERGTIMCGTHEGRAGFATQDASGNWQGFDVGFCRALAAAVLGDPRAVEFIPLSAQARLEALRAEEVDVLARATTWTLLREVTLDLSFVAPIYYDGQGFLVARNGGISSALELDESDVCIEQGTTAGENIAEFFRANNLTYTPHEVESMREAKRRYLDGDCDVFTADVAALASSRAEFADPSEHVILPEIISKEPLSPVVRAGDQRWASIVRWTAFALITAEELGITSTNLAELKASRATPEIDRLLGNDDTFGTALGLDADWAARAIAAVGNYGELFSSTIGDQTPIGLARGLNAQWTQGGLLYAPPFR